MYFMFPQNNSLHKRLLFQKRLQRGVAKLSDQTSFKTDSNHIKEVKLLQEQVNDPSSI